MSIELLAARRPTIRVCGISTRTNNSLEVDPTTSRIGPLWKQMESATWPVEISGVENPDLYCVYHDYENRDLGDYSVAIGVVLRGGTEEIPEELDIVTIPEGVYGSLGCGPGRLPDIVLLGWKSVWENTAPDGPIHRAFTADYELYIPGRQDSREAFVHLVIGLEAV
ncbi:MAG: GyrI-like domain-containing protein [Fimbriimonadaceae bacterium]